MRSTSLGLGILMMIFTQNAQDPQKVLFAAAKSGNAERIEELLTADPGLVNSKDTFGATPLHWAAIYGRKSVVAVLLRFDPDVNAVEEHGGTTLHWAAHFNDPETMDLLIEKGGNVNQQNQIGRTPLHVAARRGNPEVAATLIAHGANVNAVVDAGNSALHIAARNGHQDIIDLLLEKGANPDIQNGSRKTYSEVLFTRPPAIEIPSDLLSAYAGRYVTARKRLYHITIENGRLYYYAFGKDELVPFSETEFITDSEKLYFTFIRNTDGKVDELVFKSEGGEFRAQRIR